MNKLDQVGSGSYKNYHQPQEEVELRQKDNLQDIAKALTQRSNIDMAINVAREINRF